MYLSYISTTIGSKLITYVIVRILFIFKQLELPNLLYLNRLTFLKLYSKKFQNNIIIIDFKYKIIFLRGINTLIYS